MQDEDIRKNAQRTLEDRYGTRSAFHLPENRAQLDYDKVMRKRIKTMKKNKSFQSSCAEEAFFKLLSGRFEMVERQVRIPGTHWDIDFYIKDIDTYVQIDGVYWHGLNRPIEVIRESQKPRDQKIARGWETDRKQERWFSERGLRLLRITDRAIKDLDELPADLSEVAYFSTPV